MNPGPVDGMFGRITEIQKKNETIKICLTDGTGIAEVHVSLKLCLPLVEIGHYLYLTNLNCKNLPHFISSDESEVFNITLCKAIPNSLFLHELTPLNNNLDFFYTCSKPTSLISSRNLVNLSKFRLLWQPITLF